MNPLLQRWISADPLEVHDASSGEPNVYAYVSGRALQAVDPLGLEEVGTMTTPPPTATAKIHLFKQGESSRHVPVPRVNPQAAPTGTGGGSPVAGDSFYDPVSELDANGAFGEDGPLGTSPDGPQAGRGGGSSPGAGGNWSGLSSFASGIGQGFGEAAVTRGGLAVLGPLGAPVAAGLAAYGVADFLLNDGLTRARELVVRLASGSGTSADYKLAGTLLGGAIFGRLGKIAGAVPAGPGAARGGAERARREVGTTSNGQAINAKGEKLGPSGKPMHHHRPHKNRHQGRRAAQDRSAKGAQAIEHTNPTKGSSHAHATKKQGGVDVKKNDQMHEDY